MVAKKGEDIFASGKTEYKVNFTFLLEKINFLIFKSKIVEIRRKGFSEINYWIFQVNEQRKTDQKAVDANVLAAIKKHPDAKQLQGYFASRWENKIRRINRFYASAKFKLQNG